MFTQTYHIYMYTCTGYNIEVYCKRVGRSLLKSTTYLLLLRLHTSSSEVSLTSEPSATPPSTLLLSRHQSSAPTSATGSCT